LKSLLVCSNSTKDLEIVEKFYEKRIVTSAPDISILEEMGTYENVVAIGGGAVIDTAKILSNKPIVCYPTTAAGSSATSWSVYWDGKIKHSVKRMKPNQIGMGLTFSEDLPDNVVKGTTYDVVSHCLDSMYSKNKSKKSLGYCESALTILREKEFYKNFNLVRAGHIAGRAIEITGTNLLHSLSYPLTGNYGISHGTALGYFLPKISKLMDCDVNDIVGDIKIELDIDIEFVIDEALKYNKIYESSIFIDRKTLLEVLI
jgi:alcohol dehydrogenase class IV